MKYKSEFLDNLDISKGMIKKTEFGKDFLMYVVNKKGSDSNE